MTKYLNNVNIDNRFLGMGMLLSPFVSNNASARMDMMASHLAQIQIPEKGEHPLIFTGYESMIADYDFNTAEIPHKIQILSIVPKYKPSMTNQIQIQFNPYITVIYRDFETDEISYFNLYKYTKCADGYGYKNDWTNEHLLSEGNIIEKNTRFYTSSARNGEEYKIGVNANVAYMTFPETVEDAFCISESLANKLQPIGLKTISIKISSDRYPINLYGSQEEFKIFPDIGETVRPDGLIATFRKIADDIVISDLNDNKIFEPQYMFDECIFSPSSNAMVVDVDVYMSKKAKMPKTIYSQLKKYNDAIFQYNLTLVNQYEKYRNEKISHKFNTLITRAYSMLLASGKNIKNIKRKPNLVLIDKDKEIELQLDITIMYPKIVNKGYKLTGRDGAKGVLVSIWKDEDMPINEEGTRVDFLIDPMAVLRRTNIGQLYEQDINAVLETVRKNIQSNNLSIGENFNIVLDVLNDINPNFAKLVKSTYKSTASITDYLNYSIEHGIHVNIPPALNTINSDLPIKLHQKHDVKTSPVSFNVYDKEGNKKRITTKNSILIGKKYIFLLYKIPRASSCGGAYINQYKTPVHPSKNAENGFPIHQTPIRFGEDEFRVMISSIGPEATIRLRTLLGTSLKGIDKTIETILTAKSPSQINKIDIENSELHNDDFVLSVVHNMFRTCGIESEYILTEGVNDINGIPIDEIDKINKTLKQKYKIPKRKG